MIIFEKDNDDKTRAVIDIIVKRLMSRASQYFRLKQHDLSVSKSSELDKEE